MVSEKGGVVKGAWKNFCPGQVVVCILTRVNKTLPEFTALYGRKVRLCMSEKAKQFEFKEGEFVVTGWAEGQMEVEREDDRGNKVTVMQPYFQLFVLSPCSSFKSENYGASGLKAEKRKCSTNAVWANLHPMEVVNLYFDEKKRVVMAVSTGRAVQLDEVSF